MEKIIVYPAVVLGLLSFPACFFAGLYLIQKKSLNPHERALKRWLAAFGYSAAVFAAWWAVYFFGDMIPFGETNNSLATLSQMIGYSGYALLPTAGATAAVSLTGALVCAARRDARH